jgi:hypothetical protein
MNKQLKITAIPERDAICLRYLIKVRTLLIFELSQSESNEFNNYDQSESSTQIWVSLLRVDKQCYEFSQAVLRRNIVCTQAILDGTHDILDQDFLVK